MINRKPIALTVGDPAGIGPELILKALGARQPSQRQEFVLYGDFGLLTREAARLGLQDVLHGPRIVACSHLPDDFELGRISAAAGAAPSWQSISRASSGCSSAPLGLGLSSPNLRSPPKGMKSAKARAT
jgi:4-hydroxythreonine-4-phosphate dehydrogenase